MEVLHVPPRRRRACHLVGKADPNSKRFTDSFAVGEAEKAAVVGTLKAKGTAVRAPVTRRKAPHQKITAG